MKKLLVDHVVEAGLLTERQNTENYNHPVNDNSKNEEIVKVALLMGIGDRLLRVRKGRLVKGIFKSDESIIISEYVFCFWFFLFLLERFGLMIIFIIGNMVLFMLQAIR